VIIPGAKERIDEVLDRYGVESDFKRGIRVSPPEAIPFIKMAAFDAANRVMTLFSANRVDALIGTFVRARAIGVIEGLDYEQSGKIDRVTAEPVEQLMDMGLVPVFPCIGWSASGKPYNLSSDELALAVAQALNAVKLFFVTPGPGINKKYFETSEDMDLADDGRVIRLTVEQAERFLWLNPDEQAPDVRRVELAAQACQAGIDRVHIVDGTIEGVILKELFSALGIGTMIYKSPSDAFRPMKERDISEVLRLMRPLVEKGILKERSEEDVRSQLADYVVCDSDGMLRACGALHVYREESSAEIAAIAVNPSFTQIGLGKHLISYLTEKARAEGLRRVFVLTTQSQDWFESLGFVEGGIKDLPARKQEHYDYKRKSEVYYLDINQ
jgi:amino-acid N-acetyltransferase